MLSDTTMRTLYVRDDAAAFMPDVCQVMSVSPLLRELIVRATELPLHYDESGPAGHVVALIMSELRGLQSLPLQLPMPRDPRLRALVRGLARRAGRPTHARGLGARPSTPAPAPSPAASSSRDRPQLRRLAPAGPRARGHGPAGRRRAGHAGGARPRLRQRLRLQRHVPPSVRRLAQSVPQSSPHRESPFSLEDLQPATFRQNP